MVDLLLTRICTSSLLRTRAQRSGERAETPGKRNAETQAETPGQQESVARRVTFCGFVVFSFVALAKML